MDTDLPFTAYTEMLSASTYPTAWDDVRKYVEGLETENKEFRAGIKRLSDEEELCGETMPDEDAFNLVRMAARLSAAEARNQKIMSSLNNVVMLGEAGHYVNDAIFDALQSRAHRAEAAEARISELEKRLADAERVIEPFAGVAVSEDATSELIGQPFKADDDYCSVFSHDVKMKHFRAARAYMEGK
jgi:hypothetical protein